MPRSRPGPSIGVSLSSTAPEVWVSSPAIIRRMVDLPLPEGPSSTQIEPFSTAKETSSTAVSTCPPGRSKVLETFWI